jgi:hypothetical protein
LIEKMKARQEERRLKSIEEYKKTQPTNNPGAWSTGLFSATGRAGKRFSGRLLLFSTVRRANYLR